MTDANFSSLYQSGIISPWYLRESQVEFYSMLKTGKDIVAQCHRRFGKGTTVLTYVCERCIKEKIIVRYGTETQKQAYQIFNFLIDKIYYKDPILRPKYSSSKGCYRFDSGSEIYIFGVKDSKELDKARGTEAHIIICDEFGFWKYKAEYILKSILYPQLFETDGQMIITSTPPEDLTHNYITQVISSEAEKRLFKWTILETIAIGEKTSEDHEKIIKDSGGDDSVHYKREWLCELIPTRERLVIPEAQDELLYIGDQERPPHLDFYVCMDLGLVDHTAVLFGYLDFKQARLVIEKEYCANYESTSVIVENCKRLESELKMHLIYRRIGDCEMQQLFDMTKDHDYQVTPITKRSKQSGKGFRDSVINQLRVGINEGRILISKSGCPETVKQLKYGIWNEKRTDFERTDMMGHLDALMSLCYLFDNISWNKNPYPHKFDNLKQSENFFNQDAINEIKNKDSFKKIIGR